LLKVEQGWRSYVFRVNKGWRKGFEDKEKLY